MKKLYLALTTLILCAVVYRFFNFLGKNRLLDVDFLLADSH